MSYSKKLFLPPGTLVIQQIPALFQLQRRLVLISLFNLLLLSIVGVLLRSYPFVSIPNIEYKNLLHGHSHFAFGGWVMPVLFALIIRYFPELVQKIAFHHLRNIAALLLLSAYGMLLSFPFHGYAVVSIVFSTLSILAGFYLALVFWTVAKPIQTIPVLFLKAGLAFLVLSAIGPFATGPLIAMGKAGTPLYYDAIYFYLHFQYNGFFSFVLLAILYQVAKKNGATFKGKIVYRLFAGACVPSFFLSVLWHRPATVFYIIGGIAALVQLVGLLLFLKDIARHVRGKDLPAKLFRIAILFFALKNVMQLFSAIPSIADLAFIYRNLAIAYLHMVLLGFISLAAFAAILKEDHLVVTTGMRKGLFLFISAFLLTEIIMVLATAGNLFLPGGSIAAITLLVVSSCFPIALYLFWNEYRKASVLRLPEN